MANEEITTEYGTIEAETVDCERNDCHRTILKTETVDVFAGKKCGDWSGGNDYPEHKGVTGIHGLPEREVWCSECAEEEFDLATTAGERIIKQAESFLSTKSILSFLTGMVTVALMTILLL